MPDESINSPIPQEVLDNLVDEAVPEFTLEDLFGEQVDQQQLDEAARKLLLPNGTYTTEPPFNPKISIRDIATGAIVDSSQPGFKLDKSKHRRMANLWGTVVHGDTRGKIGYRLSPDYKNAVDWETGVELDKPDAAYKNYVQASKAYKVAHGISGDAGVTVAEILAYLRDYPHRLRIMQTSDGENRVVAISAIRPE